MLRSTIRILFTMAFTLSLTLGAFAGLGTTMAYAASQPTAAASIQAPVASTPSGVGVCYPSGYNQQGWRCGWRLAMAPYNLGSCGCSGCWSGCGGYGGYSGCGNYNGCGGYGGYSGCGNYNGCGGYGYGPGWTNYRNTGSFGGYPRYWSGCYNGCYSGCYTSSCGGYGGYGYGYR